MHAALRASSEPIRAFAEVFDRLRFGVIVTAGDGGVLEANDTARRIAVAAYGSWPDDASCCSLFGCRVREPLARHCITELASDSGVPLPELRVDMPAGRPTTAVWMTAARTGDRGSPVLIHLRPAVVGDRRQRTQPHWMAGPGLRISALGRTRITTPETAIEGRWLMQRPGQLLKFLICQRGRPAHIDEIAYALWPKAGLSGRSSVRYYVHTVRELLEPRRERRAPSSFVVSVQGSYLLDPRVAVDVDEFESLAMSGLEAARRDDAEADTLLGEAMDLYRGDLFQEDPFATWAFPERERLRGIALRSLHALVGRCRRSGDYDRGVEYLERFADLWPLDNDVQRALIDLYLRTGRHSDSQRRFAAFRHRLREEFGEEPEFELSDLHAGS